MTTKKIIMRSDALPSNIQDELAKMQAALESKYGPATHMVGTMLENLSQTCTMIRSDLTPEQRKQAYERAKEVCADVISTLARLLRVERDAALAVALAYREFGVSIEEDLLGDKVLSETSDVAAAVIAKAKSTVH